jgi:RNA polymerase sigma-70 factor (ECF subfamily)
MKKISFQNDVLPLKNVLYRLAERITLDAEEAEDVVQETMIKIWNRREQWDEIDSIEAFSLTICRNVALDHVRKNTRRTDLIEVSNDDRPDTSHSPLEQTMQRDRIEQVRKIIDSLNEKQRTCIQLRDFEGKQYKEIASIMGISEEQVKVNIHRARQTIKQKFQQIEEYGL